MQLYAVNFIPLLSSLHFSGGTHAYHQEYNVQLYVQPLVQTIVSTQTITATFSQCGLVLTTGLKFTAYSCICWSFHRML